MRADALAGKTILFATHYLEEADEFADRVVLVAGGRIVADGPAHEIRAMAAAKTVSATLPRIDVASPAEADVENRLLDHLGGLAGVESVEVQGTRLKMRTTDSDTAAKTLFDNACTDLEISSHSLEDAFISLTSQT